MDFGTYSQFVAHRSSGFNIPQSSNHSNCTCTYCQSNLALQQSELLFSHSSDQSAYYFQQFHNQQQQPQPPNQFAHQQPTQGILYPNQQTLSQQQGPFPRSLLPQPLAHFSGQSQMGVRPTLPLYQSTQPNVPQQTPIQNRDCIISGSNVPATAQPQMIVNLERATLLLNSIYETHKRSAGTLNNLHHTRN